MARAGVGHARRERGVELLGRPAERFECASRSAWGAGSTWGATLVRVAVTAPLARVEIGISPAWVWK